MKGVANSMSGVRFRVALSTVFQLSLLVLLLTACAGPPPAPVEDRSNGSSYQGTPDGYYRVKRGDSLYAIAFKFGLDWRQIAQWNDISAPYVIHPDQLLRVGSTASVATSSGTVIDGSGVQTTAAPAPGSETRTMDTPRTSSTREYDPQVDSPAGTGTATSAATTPDAGTAATETANAETSTAASTTSASKGSQQPAGVSYKVPAGDPDRWLWPTEGRIISRFQPNDPTRKGLDIGGQAGQKVVASAPGQVVYSGSGLIGYGELIIIKHSDRMLSAYAHNQKRLVSEGDLVAAGSSIAEMGTNDRSQAILHFEIRVNGVPTDPLNFLPQR
ncbi:MAG TPA: peptidoglycan DD-metalloendopeptidase family protein [Xanthomonadales bacterium]|nr:peptidoglycan DD-metalloendopeptidase family protein [Xanthomonadales bacterium]